MSNTGRAKLYLHFRRALIDTTSLGRIKTDFTLLLRGLPPSDHTSFRAYLSYMYNDSNLKNEDSSQFWQTTLDGLITRTALPQSQLTQSPTSASRKSLTELISTNDSHGLPDAQHGPTRQTFLELLWAIVLRAHTGSDDVVFATVRRDLGFFGADDCMGCLDQTYPVPLRVSPDESLDETATTLARYHSLAGRHASVGLGEISRHLPNNKKAPVVESVVVYTRVARSPCTAPGLAQFPIVLTIRDTKALAVTLTYSENVLPREAEILLEHFTTAIRNFSSARTVPPPTTNGAVELVSEDELFTLLSQAGPANPPVEGTITGLFEDAVRRHGPETALEFEDKEKLTFRELDRLSNRTAHQLLGGDIRVQKGAVIPILADRSTDLILSILAVLKAGAAYTVVDPESPQQRIATIIQSCAPPFVMAQQKHAAHILSSYSFLGKEGTTSTHGHSGPKMVVIEELLLAAYRANMNDNGTPSPLDQPPRVDIKPSDTCYVIYTSGSTGKPKGAVLSHGAAANGMAYHSLGEGLVRWLLFYHPSFSAAQRTMLSTLVHGGTLVLASKERLSTDLAAVVNDLAIDALGITPSALSLLRPDEVPNLRQITLVGEKIPQTLVDTWAPSPSSSSSSGSGSLSLKLRNTYGLSECTQINFGRQLGGPGTGPGGVGLVRASVVGNPADTTSAYILRPGSTDLCPTLVAGELCLAGPQLASGYLNEPELSAKVFVANPFGPGKLYRTGDQARRLADGQIEILGRIDLQAKINGQKVEPAEVDRALLEHEAVAACASVAVEMDENSSGSPVLIAAFVLADGFDFDKQPRSANGEHPILTSIRQHVRTRVPGYMVPSYWLPLEQLPKNANGKTDYQSLKRMARELGVTGLARLLVSSSPLGAGADHTSSDSEFGESNSGSEFDGGSVILDEHELEVASVWASVLAIDISVIGRQSAFLSLGGNSLQAIRAVAQLRRAGLVVDFATVFSDEPLERVAQACVVAADGNSSHDEEGSSSKTEIAPFSLLQDADNADADGVKQQLTSTIGTGVVDAYPATPFQAGLLATLDSDSDPYVYQRVWDVSELDIERLRDSFDQVFKARDILRTGFVPSRNKVLQVVRNDWPLPWTAAAESTTLDEYLAQDRDNKLAMAGPLFRVGVVSELGHRYLVVTMHHSLFDFWSHKFLYEDVAAVYTGKSVPSRPPFKQFVQYQQQSQMQEQSREFWKSYLADVSPSILNYAPVHVSQGEKKRQAVVQRELTGISLESESRAVGLSPGTVIYSAWAILLSRILASEDVVFATTISGRETPVLDIHRMDGPTMTSVPQRVQVDSTTSLLDVAKKVQARFLSLVKHSQLGMQEALRSASVPTAGGVLDTLVNILLFKDDDGPSEDTRAVFRRHGDRPVWASEFVVLEAEESENGKLAIRLSGSMEQHRLGFTADAFERILTSILREPAKEVSSLSIMGEAELRYLTDELSNRNTLRVPPPALLHAAFEDWAVRSPDAVAIDWDAEKQVTYRELDELADRLAHVLVMHGVVAGDRVPLMLNKSIDTMVALLGVMKAGAAYVPLNPENPVQRNGFIVQDTGAKLIVIHKEFAEFVGAVDGLKAVYIDELDLSSVEPLPVRPVPGLTPDHLAYIIYTSGSTGQPKGVKVPHRCAAAAVESMAVVEGRYEGEWRTLQFANYVFDASVQDFFNTLSTGGALCMAPTEKLLSDLVGCINRMKVKQSIITPTVARLFKPEDVPTFETLIVGGEPLAQDVVEAWKTRCRILNVYGPTETSMVVTTKDVQLGGRIGNIGAPFPTTAAFILDRNGQDLVPYGAVGELCIGGPQVTEGYVNRDDLTGAAYVYNEALGMRLYRTGDLARWLPGREVECLGRKDNQVKVHGHRIELGEVESAIRKTGLVQDVVVLVASVNGSPRLVAFCIFNDSESASAEDGSLGIQDAQEHTESYVAMRESLGSLATYMVPKFVIPMGNFPKLPSRKVDRKSLQKMLGELDTAVISRYTLETAGDHVAEVVAPETPQEEALVQMWSDLFGIPAHEIGRESNFLSLGGESIFAISLASMARQAGYVMTVPNILRLPKLKDLAATMKETNASGGGATKKRVFEIPAAVEEAIKDAGLSIEEDVEYGESRDLALFFSFFFARRLTLSSD